MLPGVTGSRVMSGDPSQHGYTAATCIRSDFVDESHENKYDSLQEDVNIKLLHEELEELRLQDAGKRARV